MKLGLLTAILDTSSFEEVVEIASEMEFSSLEVACWPSGSAERRYAGVSHIDCERVCEDDIYADSIRNLVDKKHLAISSARFLPKYPGFQSGKALRKHCTFKNCYQSLPKARSKYGKYLYRTRPA